MESLLENIDDLRQRTPYCDLEIRCDRTSFFVHRFVVCSKSKVLATECDGGSKEGITTVVEHALFDALTLERMLLFMYRGDYTASVSTKGVEETGEGDKGRQKYDAASKTLPPHLRNGASLAMSTKVSARKPVYGQRQAHVYVYAIAEHYDMADLKALALGRFKHSDVVVTVDEFLEVAKSVYRNTITLEDELRRALLSTLLNKYSDWLADGQFMGALADDEDLRAFIAAVVPAVSQRSAEQATVLQTQHKANLQLHSGLDQMTEDLRTANNQIAELREEQGKAVSANFNLEEKLRSCESWAKENLEKAGNNYKAVEERDYLIKKETERADQCSELVRQKDEMIREKDEKIKERDEKIKEKDQKIKEETDRANQNHQLCMQKDQVIIKRDQKLKEETERANKNYKACMHRDRQIKEETDRANKNYEACMQKDHQIKANKMNDEAPLEAAKEAVNEQRARAEKAFRHFHQAQNLINHTNQCRHCGWGCFPRLFKDERKTVYIHCTHCNMRDYAERID